MDEVAFSWSYSRLKNFETCPRRYKAIDVDKRVTEEESPALREGGMTHKAFAAYLKSQTPLPVELQLHQHYLDHMLAMPGELHVEEQWAITAQFTPTKWFGKDVWCRTIGDALVVDQSVAVLRDWKTGKVRVDETQLGLTANFVFIRFPDVKLVRADFVWLQEAPEDALTGKFYKREDAVTEWINIMPRVKKLEEAHTKNEFPPKPNFFCGRCPVKECEYNGGR